MDEIIKEYFEKKESGLVYKQITDDNVVVIHKITFNPETGERNDPIIIGSFAVEEITNAVNDYHVRIESLNQFLFEINNP